MVKIDENKLGDKPIEPHLNELMNALAQGIDTILNGQVEDVKAKRNGFILMVFPFEGHEGRANYISNATRSDVVVMLKHQVARFDGQPDVSGTA